MSGCTIIIVMMGSPKRGQISHTMFLSFAYMLGKLSKTHANA